MILLIFRTIFIRADGSNAYVVCVYLAFDENTSNMFECSSQSLTVMWYASKQQNRTVSKMYDPWSNAIVDTSLIFYIDLLYNFFSSFCLFSSHYICLQFNVQNRNKNKIVSSTNYHSHSLLPFVLFRQWGVNVIDIR